MLDLFGKGFIIGILVSAPMGPVGILCIQRTLSKGRLSGFVSGLGAMVSDVIYALITGLSVGLIIDLIETYQKPIELFGSVILGVFGYFIYRSNPVKNLQKNEESKSTYLNDFSTSFLLTFSNFLIVLLFIGLYTRFSFALPVGSIWKILSGLGGVALGAVFFWFVITYLVSCVRKWFNIRAISLLNKVVGVITVIVAIVGIVNSLSAG